MSAPAPTAAERRAAWEALRLLGNKKALAPDDVRGVRRTLLTALASRGGPPPVGPNAPEETQLHKALTLLRDQPDDLEAVKDTLWRGLSSPAPSPTDGPYGYTTDADPLVALETLRAAVVDEAALLTQMGPSRHLPPAEVDALAKRLLAAVDGVEPGAGAGEGTDFGHRGEPAVNVGPDGDHDRDFAEAAAQDRAAAIEERLEPEQEYESYQGPLGWDAWLQSRDDPEGRQKLEEGAYADDVDPEAAAARDVAARNQARPVNESTTTDPKGLPPARGTGTQGAMRDVGPSR